ncbi:MAG: class I SAM-dependent methyltransferase [Chloroflexota bacterium]
MNDHHLDQVARGFSHKALIYDEFGRDHVNLNRMRRRVYDHFTALVPPGSRVLEINAGTGYDAANLVQRGYRVHATDIAPGMLTQIKAKIASQGLADRLTVQDCSFTELDQVAGGPFDAVFSNMGGLNCIDDLTQVTHHLPTLLRPGGVVTWVIMPPICPWELIKFAKDFRVATRRLKRKNILAHVEGAHFAVYYFTPREVLRAFGPQFTPLKLEGLSVLTPTADSKDFAVNHPRLYRLLAWLDDRLCEKRPFCNWGDFFISSSRYR